MPKWRATQHKKNPLLVNTIEWAESNHPTETRLFLDWRDKFVMKFGREPLPNDVLEMIESSRAPDKQKLARFFLDLVNRRRLQKKKLKKKKKNS